MENQTRFDLNAARENWRQELGAQPYMTPEHLRELETHLRDSLAELKARGLNDEESFLVARRRLGPPQKLAEEFMKANPAAVWRERVFWFVFGLLVLRFWDAVIVTSTFPFLDQHGSFNNVLPDWVMFYMPRWLQVLRIQTLLYGVWIVSTALWIAAVVFIATGRMQKIRRVFEFAIQSRARFMATAFTCVALIFAIQFFVARSMSAANVYHIVMPVLQNNFGLLWLIAIGVWLLPAKSRSVVR